MIGWSTASSAEDEGGLDLDDDEGGGGASGIGSVPPGTIFRMPAFQRCCQPWLGRF
jgi:hypothetical protein